jgi:uncharacterized protein
MQSNRLMEAEVVNILKTQLPETYYYHNYAHTLYVAEKAIAIGREEGCRKEDLNLLYIAALWHDTGFINSYQHHEEESCVLAAQYLARYHYPPETIQLVREMIMATRIPQSPQNKLEEILADADLEYLGTANAPVMANNLLLELQSLDPSLSEQQWNQIQVSFIREHHYFTRFCQQNRETAKQQYLSTLVRKLAE